MTGFNDWIMVEPTSMSSEDRPAEVEELVRQKLATRIGPQLRTRIDPGVNIPGSDRAQKVRVRSEEGRIVIDEQDQAAVLGGTAHASQKNAPSPGVEGLFQMSDGIPSFVEKGDGSVVPVYRTISPRELFNTKDSDRDDVVEGVVGNTIQNNFVEVLEESIDEVNRQNPK